MLDRRAWAGRITRSSPRTWSSVFKASLDELRLGAGLDIKAALESFGARAVGTKAEVFAATGTHQNYLCATFPPGAHLVPIAAYVLTRIAPLRDEPPLDGEIEPSTITVVRAIDMFDTAALHGRGLYAWQEEALEAWFENECRGIVEAVTGSGKTRIAVEAIRDTLDIGSRAMVVVPLIGLQDQWAAELRRQIPGVHLGFLGGGGSAKLLDCDVLISTIQSAHSSEVEGIGPNTLLVVDEVHRAGAQRFSRALKTSFGRRLGLSATYERMDGAHDTLLLPYFEEVVYSYDYDRAIAERVISPFRVALIGVAFRADERVEYDRLSDEMSRARSRLVHHFGVPGEPFADFITAVYELAKDGTREQGIAANRYLRPFTQRRQLMAATDAKFAALNELAGTVKGAHGALVFTETVEAAERAGTTLRHRGINAVAIHSQLPVAHRAEDDPFLRTRRCAGDRSTRVLDEGLDVPEADLAIVHRCQQATPADDSADGTCAPEEEGRSIGSLRRDVRGGDHRGSGLRRPRSLPGSAPPVRGGSPHVPSVLDGRATALPRRGAFGGGRRL